VIFNSPKNFPIQGGLEYTPTDYGKLPPGLFPEGKNPWATPREFESTIFFGGESHEDGSFSGFVGIVIKHGSSRSSVLICGSYPMSFSFVSWSA